MTNNLEPPGARRGIGPGISDLYGWRTAGIHAGFVLPHLAPGMRVLDCGCGPGSITVGLAETVAPGTVASWSTKASGAPMAIGFEHCWMGHFLESSAGVK